MKPTCSLTSESDRLVVVKSSLAFSMRSSVRYLRYGAFKKLGIYGKYSNHDWRSTFGSQLKEQGMSSALVADLLGHADTRMVETTYARTRHEGVMKQRQAVENLNAFL